jgi:endonuclease YncB( thermonuclease family)
MIDPSLDLDGDSAEEPSPWRRMLDAIKHRRVLSSLTALVVLAAAGAAIWDGPAKGVDMFAVYDGDTLDWTPRDCALSDIGLSCLTRPLRLFGVDAFEKSQTCHDAGGKVWACGAAATQRLKTLAIRPDFSCNFDNDRLDRNSRDFALCIADGQDVGATLVSEGLAFYYGRGLQYLPIEAAARRDKKGAWAGSFVRPQFWRQGARD